MYARLQWILVLVFLSGWALPAPSQVNPAADKLYWQAVTKHSEGMISEAAELMKVVTILAPKDKSYLEYTRELAALSARQKLDDHALAAPAEAEKSIATLAKYLVKPAKNDEEKVRLIFRWMTDRIAYDTKSFFSGQIADTGVEAVLSTRQSVCAGYSRLFEALCKEAGLEVAEISGFAKGYGYEAGNKITRTNHAWNAVRLNGRWLMVDSTWGAGNVDTKFNKKLDNYYYLTPPELFVYSHFPDDEKLQHLPTPINKERFEAWPEVNHNLFGMGFSAEAVRQQADQKGGFVQAFNYPGLRINVVKAPLTPKLRAGEKVAIRVEAPGAPELVAINGEDFSKPAMNGVFEETLTPQKGTLRISARLPGKDENLWPILIYQVE